MIKQWRRMSDARSVPSKVMYLTVLPFYRQKCIESLLTQAEDRVCIYAGPRQLTASVTTGISPDLYRPLKAFFLFDRVIVLRDHWADAIRAESLMVDLNPRCASAWAMLAIRKVLGRRTLVWGHLFPRAGAGSWTARLRRFMRSLANGTVLYGFDSVVPARQDLPEQPVWVAPNALYSRDVLGPCISKSAPSSVIYVGRLVPEKKVDLLIQGFALAARNIDTARLKIVGQGSDLASLKTLANDLGCGDRISFLGPITETEKLERVYADALCSVSPGYVGLSLTQSLGFGVPMLIADNEPHAPEVELERFGGVLRFTEDDPSSLGALLQKVYLKEVEFPSAKELARPIQANYSAESMAMGLLDSLAGTPQDLDDTGWPRS
ncbi:glycosyltransferase family 4 protein [Pseudarthrobacter oxydans]|uniref:glycosyltransferase family 4 protein n=1 Tax=Pseudarthrobacter oxydans TaxID=1671 RepID=UPI001571B16B|nr:glycosyltransferase family 4 protein [Pseudarthrobacter oxydans]NSX38682.1 glycosyltransferase family 4 protein [Pseudarthrobacter oxydans]